MPGHPPASISSSKTLIQMKYFMQVHGHRAVVRIRFHDVRHEIPPFAVDRRICALVPLRRIFYFNISVQDQRLPVPFPDPADPGCQPADEPCEK